MGKKGKDDRPPPPEGSCHFYVQRKNRYCRFAPVKNFQYCAEHATVQGVDLGRKRVDCPYNPKHTCYAEKLNHHKKKCPDRPREMPPYYSAGINTGDDAGETVPDPKVTVLKVSITEVEDIIGRVNALYDEHIGQIVEEILSHECLSKELAKPNYGTAALRHRRQQASLIGQMQKLSLLREGMCYLEMGAGKGQLTHWVHEAVTGINDVGFVLIDRSHVRNKMDNLHKEEQLMERLRIDIEHLKLEEVPSIKKHQRQVLAFGKHLCGGATDLSLRCVIETLPDRAEPESEDGGGRKRFKSDYKRLAGAVIALCCHHRCTWTPYVGKNFFRSCGLSARDFQLISSMSSWATCAWKGWSNERKAGDRKTSGPSNTAGEQRTTGPSKNDASGNQHIDSNSSNMSERNTDKDSAVLQGEESSRTDNTEGEDIVVKLTADSAATSSAADECVAVADTAATSSAADESVAVADTAATSSAADESVAVADSAATSSAADESVAVADSEADGATDDGGGEPEHQVDEEVTNTGINSKLSQGEREIIGRKCKRLIDYGRVKYLQEHGFNSSIKEYIEEFYTPENVVLLAW